MLCEWAGLFLSNLVVPYETTRITCRCRHSVHENCTPWQYDTSCIVCLLLTFIPVVICSSLVTVCINRLNKEHLTTPAQNTRELHVDPTYEEVDTLQNQTIRLEENVAYGPVKQSQNIELKENIAYGPVKWN